MPNICTMFSAHLLDSTSPSVGADLRRRQCQVGSLAGVAHLLNNNAGGLSWLYVRLLSQLEQPKEL